jgi:hypothetical protein
MAREAIFIGYRRDDTADVAGRIFDALESRFGRDRIFKDVDNLRPGADFGEYIQTILPRCRVALILIGPNWVNAQDEDGRRRLDDPNDWVRIEIEIALAAGDLDVVPVLINGARMPRAEELPPSLHPLLRRHAATIRRDPDFRDDIDRLAKALRASMRTGLLDLGSLGGDRRPQSSAVQRPSKADRMPLLIGGIVAGVLAVSAIGFGVSRWLPVQGAEEQPATPEATLVEAVPLEVPEMVRIPGQNFEVGRYEVTFAQWDECVAAGGCNGYRPDDQGWGRGNRPVTNVSWNDAQAYVQWLSSQTGERYRLLTEAEWEYAARAGTTTNFSWGDQDPVCDQSAGNGANFGGCTDDRTRPVGSFQPNGFGLYDVHGNVWEWVEDCYDGSCSSRVIRGGSWANGPGWLRSPFRLWSYPGENDNVVGFRVARTV